MPHPFSTAVAARMREMLECVAFLHPGSARSPCAKDDRCGGVQVSPRRLTRNAAVPGH